MIVEKIKQKFLEIDPPILFLFDASREYEDELHAENGSDFKTITVDQNYFRVKYEVEFRDKSEKILLYHPFEEPKRKEYKDYPLTDLLLAGSILAVDDLAEILDIHKIPLQLRADLEPLKKWIKVKKNQSRLLPALSQKPFDLQKLQNYVLSIILDEKKTGNSTHNVIRAFELLQEGKSVWEKKQQVLMDSGLDQTLKENVFEILHLEMDDISFDAFRNLFLKIKYNIITLFIGEANKKDLYTHLKVNNEISKIKISNFFKDWQDDKNKSKNFEQIFSSLGSLVDEHKIYDVYGTHEEYGIKTKQSIEVELRHSLDKIIDLPKEVIQKYGSYKNNTEEFEGYENKVGFILNSARFFNLLKRYTDFVFNHLEDYIERYAKEIYKLDLYYREAFTAYQSFTEVMDGHYAKVFDVLNSKYDQYLIDLNNPWVKSLDEISFDYTKITSKKQYHFYKDFVEPITNKKVVIISDAFRYELAVELMEELKAEPENEVSCEGMLASIPSYTNLGMSNLLPNNGIATIVNEDSIDYSINGIKTVSSNREAILKSFDENAAVIDYATFSKFNTEEGRDFLKDKQTVYVYHNWMDAIGDKKSSEYYTFESVEQCILQLKTLIRKLHNGFNIRNVLVTADHGFLFNFKDISVATAQKFPPIKSRLKEHTRFSITQDTTKPEDCFIFPLSATTNIDTDVNVVLPKAINRFKKQGNFGKQFIHGGSSLQEVVVPVLQFYRNRNNQAVAVGFTRIDNTTSVSTSVFKLKLVQSHPIGADYKARTIVVNIVDIDNNIISNSVELTLDSISNIPTERVFEVKVELNSQGSKVKIGYIKIFDKGDSLNPLLSDLLKINLLEEIDEF